MIRVLAPLLFCLSLALPAQACRLALALTIDVSGSIDPGEFEFQMVGLADALEDPEVQDALVLSQAAVMVMQWSGRNDQHISIPWRRMLSYGAVEALADQVRATKRRWHGGKTAPGEMLAHVLAEFGDVADCTKRVIDVSGDGATNDGMDTVGPRGQARLDGVVINGVAIDRMGQSVAQFYRNFIATGRDSFVLRATGYSDYPRAIRQKLLRETTIPAM